MPNYLRNRVPGGTYFFTLCLADRCSGALVNHIDTFRLAYAHTKRDLPWQDEALVVLPDHLHAVWTLPEGDADYSRRWGAIKARFSRAMGRAGFIPPPPIGRVNGGVNPALRRKGEVGLWQPRFWEHTIRNDADLATHIAYCWGNPVKHGLVKCAVDWPYSSIHRDIQLGRVDAEWAGEVSEAAFGP